QIRDNAIEAARQTANRLVVKKLGKTGFKMKIRTYPHHILRENPLASGAGADRMSTGMKMSFGKPIGIAARIMKGQTIMELNVPKQNVAVAKEALKRAGSKFPCGVTIEVQTK
ncbi:TPA: 50S ribosomal protein L16, partial [Candidatus Woesearchaeota archaeon]|nr:50S ribosomal protein L16 [Candidatus Woesearchaeota archaeon]